MPACKRNGCGMDEGALLPAGMLAGLRAGEAGGGHSSAALDEAAFDVRRRRALERGGEYVVKAEGCGDDAAQTLYAREGSNSTEAVGGEFDDLVLWESRFVLFGRMIASGQLP